MTIMEAMEQRHSVRRYTEQNIEGEALAALRAAVAECNAESKMNIRLVIDEPDAASGLITKLRFPGAKNFFVLAGADSVDLDEKAGYYGERLVLKAQQLGLNTCWAMMFSGKKFSAGLAKNERIAIIVSVGYGVDQGVPHKSKPLESLCKVSGDMPAWFRSGMEAAMLAPTGLNKQGFLFTLSGNTVKAESTGSGALSRIDLGIAKYHFETGAGIGNFTWL